MGLSAASRGHPAGSNPCVNESPSSAARHSVFVGAWCVGSPRLALGLGVDLRGALLGLLAQGKGSEIGGDRLLVADRPRVRRRPGDATGIVLEAIALEGAEPLPELEARDRLRGERDLDRA